MNRISHLSRLALLLSVLTLSSCSPNPNSSAVGKLSGDWGLTAANRLMQKLGEDAQAAEPEKPASDEAGEPRMMLQFGARGWLKTTTKMGRFDPPPKEGTWKLLRWDEASQEMTIECTIAGQTTEHDVRFLEPDLIELVPPNLAGTNSKLRFQRLK